MLSDQQLREINPISTTSEEIREMARELLSRRNAERWIPVSEGVPNFTKGSTGDGADFAYLGWDGAEVLALDEYNGYWPWKVTHWRPLPTPPSTGADHEQG